ncbi:unnamed protein product [Closterium sp. NIES-65]|nr:unnamed protein product [Closterium sp. NIES-65]
MQASGTCWRTGCTELITSPLSPVTVQLLPGDEGMLLEGWVLHLEGSRTCWRNWVLHLERVGLGRHFIVFAADSKSLEFAHSKWPGQAIYLNLSVQFGSEERADVEGGGITLQVGTPLHRIPPLPLLQAIHLDLSGQFGQEERADVEGASVIGTAAFHRVASHRAIYIHHLLSFGFSVLYSDIDIAFLHNPLPFFQKPDSSGSSSGQQ